MVLIWAEMPHLTCIFGGYNIFESRKMYRSVLVKMEMLR